MLRLLALSALAFPGHTAAAGDQTFEMLQIGTQTYRNVTVTTKAKSYVFFLHSAGMANIKVSDLTPDVLEKLGYAAAAEKPKAKVSPAAAWVQNTLKKIGVPQLKTFESRIEQNLHNTRQIQVPSIKTLPRKTLYLYAGALFVAYFFSCYCYGLICFKAGKPAGPLVWIPLLQIFPLLRAAGMSPAWILGFPLLPFVWPVKIAKARGKSGWTGLFLMLPVTSLFAFLYLAFSNGAAPKERRTIEIMTLETA